MDNEDSTAFSLLRQNFLKVRLTQNCPFISALFLAIRTATKVNVDKKTWTMDKGLRSLKADCSPTMRGG
uniref:Uncharacterized protein n=1 Tax=Ascaris lumbricoides TaxID=6252 RepID=A0A0M3HYT5_ASCLU